MSIRTVKVPFIKSDYDKTWSKHCGFLDLSMEQFMTIQQALLMEQLDTIGESPMAGRFLGKRRYETVSQFLESAPVTTYEDYASDFENGGVALLPERPYVWAHTSHSSGFKKVPYTQQFYEQMLDNLMAAFILSCSRGRNQSSLTEGDRVLYNVAPSPYLSGILAHGASETFNLVPIIKPDSHDGMDFKEKISRGFELSLKDGLDILIAMTSVLVKMGNDFDRRTKKTRFSKRVLQPGVMYRYLGALIKSKLEHRRIMPKDLWNLKSIIGWGIDTPIYREHIRKYWGHYPYEFHACTEAGIIGMQSWTRKDLTFVPDSNFYEFIPEAEWLKTRIDKSYQPKTVLLDQVEPGKLYELVITSYNRMPFIRYRLGHLVRITSLSDKEAKIDLPQMVFEARADDLIDIAGFTRLSEKTVAQAIANSGIECEDWFVRKEQDNGRQMVNLYMEMNGGREATRVAEILDEELRKVDRFYSDLGAMMDSHPLNVTLLHPGTFKKYYEKQKQAGAELHELKPPRMNAPGDIVREIVDLNKRLN